MAPDANPGVPESGREGALKPEIVVVRPYMPQIMAALEQDFTVHRLWQAEDRNALLEQARAARAIATMGDTGADAALMDALPDLEIIACMGVGVDAIDLAHARGRGIAVTYTPDVLNDEVANTAVALLLAVTRRICAGDRYVREGRWLEAPMVLTRSVVGRPCGILGLGRIGKAIARRVEALGGEVAYHARHEQPDQPYRYCADLVELARDSDFLIVITPGGAATARLVDRPVLDALGPTGVLINVSRGSVVDEPALVAALAEGRLGAAGLDVFADEPNVPEALLARDNVVLQPHVGSATEETRGRMCGLVVDNLRAHFAGQPLITPVP
jgi:lactate dehydrogenase-like 2-hydroxyacid dehydrogenase